MSTWFKSTPESEAILAEERLVLAATELVYEALEMNGGKTKAELAKLLGLSPSEVSQRLSGRRNLTLRTLAAMLHKLGAGAELVLMPQQEPVLKPDFRQSKTIENVLKQTYTQPVPTRVRAGCAV